eukprot:11316704-Alexandrium_andersonii.AAC.1
MSASLVGSEMCIRDSLGTSAPKSRSGRPCVRGARPPAPSKPRDPRPEPVSYTHLTLPTICSV